MIKIIRPHDIHPYLFAEIFIQSRLITGIATIADITCTDNAKYWYRRIPVAKQEMLKHH